MMTPKALSLILALAVLTTLIMYVNSLPITSKPIESTAENLAWQAWLMLPPEQKNLEKSRKVTPKSIFTLPFRDCPPDHQLFENRCIPTVQIDATALLTQELLGFVDGGGGGGDINYEEFDYDFVGDDEGGEILAEVMFEPAQKLNGKDESYDQLLPSQDEPLKFNIFEQKFPTDYENVPPMANSEEIEKQRNQTLAKSSNSTVNATQLAEAVNGLAIGVAPMQSVSNANGELQMESSNVSVNIDKHTPTASTTTTTTKATTTHFAIGDIDAIVLPATTTTSTTRTRTAQRIYGNGDVGSGAGAVAVATGDSIADYLETKKQNIHKFSLFKDDASVQLITSSLLTNNNNNNNNENSKQPDFTQLLKADDLLPLPLPNVASTSSANVNEVPTLSTINTGESAASSTTLLSGHRSSATTNSVADDAVDDSTDMMLTAVEATMPTISKVENFAKKIEHPRSVIDGLESEAQELKFMTTTEAIGTTNFQLDETTIVESEGTTVQDAATPTKALKELLNLAATYPVGETVQPNDGLRVVKKSKVEPVELPPIIMENEAEEQKVTAAIAAADELNKINNMMTPMATPSQQTTATTDRFFNYQQKLNTKTGEQQSKVEEDTPDDDDDGDDEDDKLNFSNMKTTKTTTTKTKTTPAATTTIKTPATAITSEIDIVQESRLINEPVKGNENSNNINRNAFDEHQLKPEVIKSATTESGPATATISAFTNVDVESSSSSSSGTSTQSTTMYDTSVQTTSTAVPAAASTSTIWSKIMPLLGLSESSDQTTNSANINSAPPATTPKSLNRFGAASSTPSLSSSSATAKTTTTTSATTSTKNKPNPSIFSNNRSNRNSKIIRINSLSSFSSSTNGKAQQQQQQQQHITSGYVGKQTADKLTLSSPQSSELATTIVEASTSTSTPSQQTTAAFAEISEKSSGIGAGDDDDVNGGGGSIIDFSPNDTALDNDNDDDGDATNTSTTTEKTDSDSNQGEPFWWLPIGWRLDRANEPSLLLRFWSALPGQGE